MKESMDGCEKLRRVLGVGRRDGQGKSGDGTREKGRKASSDDLDIGEWMFCLFLWAYGVFGYHVL